MCSVCYFYDLHFSVECLSLTWPLPSTELKETCEVSSHNKWKLSLASIEEGTEWGDKDGSDKGYGKRKSTSHSGGMKSMWEPGDPSKNIIWEVESSRLRKFSIKGKMMIWTWWCLLLIPKLWRQKQTYLLWVQCQPGLHRKCYVAKAKYWEFCLRSNKWRNTNNEGSLQALHSRD